MIHSISVPPARLRRFRFLLDASVRAFGEYGYQRCQIADIAKEARMALGTIYRYAESKMALFDAAVRHGFGDASALEPNVLPLPEPEPGATVTFLRTTLTGLSERLTFENLLGHEGPMSIEDELRLAIGKVYDTLEEGGAGIRMVDYSAREWPELAQLLYGEMRGRGMAEFARYLEARIAAGQLVPVPDVPTAVRQIIEMCAWMGFHRKWNPSEEGIRVDAARETVLHFVLRTLLPSPGERQ